jgi:hypothetical protein
MYCRDDKHIVALRANGFFACAAFGNANSPLTVFAEKLNDGRFGRYSDNIAAFGAFSLLAGTCIQDTDFMSTVIAAKLNH